MTCCGARRHTNRFAPSRSYPASLLTDTSYKEAVQVAPPFTRPLGRGTSVSTPDSTDGRGLQLDFSDVLFMSTAQTSTSERTYFVPVPYFFPMKTR